MSLEGALEIRSVRLFVFNTGGFCVEQVGMNNKVLTDRLVFVTYVLTLYRCFCKQ